MHPTWQHERQIRYVFCDIKCNAAAELLAPCLKMTCVIEMKRPLSEAVCLKQYNVVMRRGWGLLSVHQSRILHHL